MAYTWPVPLATLITQYFGTNAYSPVQPQGHTGMDFALPVGSSVKSIGAGTVLWADWATKLAPGNKWWIAPAYAGIVVLIDHGPIISVYAHLDSTPLNIGQKVAQGQEIGKSGNTGLSTGPHLHFEIMPTPVPTSVDWLAGRVDPLKWVQKAVYAPNAPLAANQRKVGAANLNQRASANNDSKIIRIIKANTVETFTGFVRGENISLGGVTSNIWYKDAQGYVWAGGFTSQSTSGLKDLTPVDPTWRKTGGSVSVYRKYPSLTAAKLGEMKANTNYVMKAYTTGDSWSGTNIWFQLQNGGWAHSKLFTSQATTALPKVATPKPPVAPAPAPAPTPAPTPEPVEPAYSFTPDFDFVEYEPADTTNMQHGNFPTDQSNVVIHQFDAKAKQPSIEGVINHFQTVRPGAESSAHFVVSGKRIVQMVSLKDRAFHAGAVGNNWVGIEVDPMQDSDTIASVKKLLVALKEKYGKELTKHLHKNVTGNATNCGIEISLSDYDLTPEEPPVIVVPVPEPEPTPVPLNEEQIIDDFLQWLKQEYFLTKK